MTTTTLPDDANSHGVDEMLPAPRLAALGLQHVLVMYAGAVAVPLIVGRALKLGPEQVALLISADLFCCGLVTLIQSFGLGRWFGIRLPVMMGVTFASVGPMVAMANAMPGVDGARAIFGAIIAAGIVSILIAPFVSRMLRFFPPVVTGTIIAVIGISLMRVGINWIFGNPFGPTAPNIIDPVHAKWLADVTSPGSALPPALLRQSAEPAAHWYCRTGLQKRIDQRCCGGACELPWNAYVITRIVGTRWPCSRSRRLFIQLQMAEVAAVPTHAWAIGALHRDGR